MRGTFDDIFRFWSDRGVAGFRIDVCNVIIKDAELRDNPPATEDDDFETQMFGQRSVYNANRPEVHEVIRRWRVLADGYDEPRLLIGETPVPVDKLAEFYGSGSDELGLAFNFNFISAPFQRPRACGPSSRRPRRHCRRGPGRRGRAPTTTCSASRPAGPRTIRPGSGWPSSCCCRLRGTPVLYQGDEIGMANVTVAHEDMRDPLGVRFYPYYEGRDAGRTPMQWSERPGGGFTDADRPWLPLGDLAAANVAAQRDDPGSVLALCRDLIAFRRRHPAFSAGDTTTLRDARDGLGVDPGRAPRGRPQHVAGGVVLPGLSGTMQICTDRARDLEVVGGDLRLAPSTG